MFLCRKQYTKISFKRTTLLLQHDSKTWIWDYMTHNPKIKENKEYGPSRMHQGPTEAATNCGLTVAPKSWPRAHYR